MSRRFSVTAAPKVLPRLGTLWSTKRRRAFLHRPVATGPRPRAGTAPEPLREPQSGPKTGPEVEWGVPKRAGNRSRPAPGAWRQASAKGTPQAATARSPGEVPALPRGPGRPVRQDRRRLLHSQERKALQEIRGPQQPADPRRLRARLRPGPGHRQPAGLEAGGRQPPGPLAPGGDSRCHTPGGHLRVEKIPLLESTTDFAIIVTLIVRGA